jgi:hypothetical protein
MFILFFMGFFFFCFWKFVVFMFDVSLLFMFIFDDFIYMFMASMSLENLLFMFDVYVSMFKVC